MLREILEYKLQSPSNKQTLQTQEDAKTNYSTYNSPLSFKDVDNIQRGTQIPNQIQTITISNQTINHNHPTQLCMTTSSNTRHKKTLSSPNVMLLESLIDDLSNNLINKRSCSKKTKTKNKKDLEKSINDLTERINSMKSDLEQTQSSIKTLINIKESSIFKQKRIQKEALHSNVEKIFLNKKIKDIRDEIDCIQKETRNAKYNNFRSRECCFGVNEGTHVNTSEIKRLIEEKKNLATALIMVNRKKIETQEILKDLAVKCDRFVTRVKDLVEKEKEYSSIYLNA